MRLEKCLKNPSLVFLFQNMLNRRSFSDVLPESPKSARKKEEARQAEFVRIGQVCLLPQLLRSVAVSPSKLNTHKDTCPNLN